MGLVRLAFFITLHVATTAKQIYEKAPDGSNKTVLTVGYLTNTRGPAAFRQGVVISGAMSYAVETINNDTQLLPNHYLKFIWDDTKGDPVVSTKKLTNQWKNGAVAFFGPEDTCAVEATCAAAWNLPMISYKCSEPQVSDKSRYSTFARTNSAPDQIVKSVIALLRKFKWIKFSIIYEDNFKYSSVAQTLQFLAKKDELLNVNHMKPFVPLWNDRRPMTFSFKNQFATLLNETHKGTRIYVFFGCASDLFNFMRTMFHKILLDKGDYMVIYVDLDPYFESEVYKSIWHTIQYEMYYNAIEFETALKTVESLLVVLPSPTDFKDYTKFQEKVNFYNQLPPFNFPDFAPNNKLKHITMYAAHLYDAIYLYARALDKVLKNGGDERDGKEIIRNIIEDGKYRSICGMDIKIDKNGDSRGKYSLYAFVKDSRVHSRTDFAKVGTFQEDADDNTSNLPTLYFHKNRTIMWIAGQPPPSEPPCGFDGSFCTQNPPFPFPIGCKK